MDRNISFLVTTPRPLRLLLAEIADWRFPRYFLNFWFIKFYEKLKSEVYNGNTNLFWNPINFFFWIRKFGSTQYTQSDTIWLHKICSICQFHLFINKKLWNQKQISYRQHGDGIRAKSNFIFKRFLNGGCQEQESTWPSERKNKHVNKCQEITINTGDTWILIVLYTGIQAKILQLYIYIYIYIDQIEDGGIDDILQRLEIRIQDLNWLLCPSS